MTVTATPDHWNYKVSVTSVSPAVALLGDPCLANDRRHVVLAMTLERIW
jgi:hypothetical protein